MRLLFLVSVIVALVSFGCQSTRNAEFGIYLLTDDRPATELAQSDLNDLPLQDKPLISSADIVAYHKGDHIIELTPSAYAKVQAIFPKPVRVDGIPFVVAVGDERIYAGGFWTPLSSRSYDGVVILEPWEALPTDIRIGLGYPSTELFVHTDPRSDPRIIEALEQANKIK